MTTAAFTALAGPTARALAEIKNRYCAPPTYAPAESTEGHMACPRCKSRLNFTVQATGLTSGRCVAGSCVKWDLQ